MTDRILLTVPAGSRGSGVVALVLGGLGARLELPVDRLDELSLAVSTIAPSVLGDRLELELNVSDDRLMLRIGPLEEGTTADVARWRVIEALVDTVGAVSSGSGEWFELELALQPEAAGTQ